MVPGICYLILNKSSMGYSAGNLYPPTDLYSQSFPVLRVATSLVKSVMILVRIENILPDIDPNHNMTSYNRNMYPTFSRHGQMAL